MSLPSPNLDDRPFQRIVDDVKRQIGGRCPEWTEHNVSDPGVTLIELFAWMTEMSLYRLNQVPEKNYIKFLEMIGVGLEPPAPAQTDLRFRLTRSIEDQDGEEAFERTLRARETVAATVRTENEESVEFSTDSELRMVRPRLVYVGAMGNLDPPAVEDDVVRKARDFAARQAGFQIFGAVPRDGDALYLGFEADVSGNTVELEAGCIRSAAPGLNEDYPAQRWEFWNGAENRWDPLEISLDSTFGFNRPPGEIVNGMRSGFVHLEMPRGMISRQLGGRRAYWVRCRYTPELPPRGRNQLKPDPYEKSPEVTYLTTRVIGGSATASNNLTVSMQELGQSDGTPGQIFTLGRRPILTREPGETVLVGEQGTARGEMQEWTEVEDFAESGPEDRHFTCDSFAGEIRFGPRVIQPQGSARQHGAVPEKGMTVAFSAYRQGGGTRGNVAAGTITILKTSIPYISEVVNPERADGGREQEVLERAKLRGRQKLRLRDRAVTAEDYEYLAMRASSAVGWARCAQPRYTVHSQGQDGANIPPGVVRVLIVPALSDSVAVPRPADLKVAPRIRQEVEDFLDERRLLSTVLEVAEPEFVYISTEITLIADPKADPDQVRNSVRTHLETYFHPLRGGPNGNGWPFRRTLNLSDIYAQVQAARGVAFLTDAKIFVSRLVNRDEGHLGPEQLISNTSGVHVADDELLCTREHRIRVRAMNSVGMDTT